MLRILKWLVAALSVVLFAGCALAGTWDDGNVAGTWSSPESGASVTFHRDGTFEATDFPIPTPNGGCTQDGYTREPLHGTWAALDQDFIYANELGIQIWKGRTAS